MGRVFLVLIVVGLVWGGYKVYQNVTGLMNGDALAHRYRGAGEAPVISEGKDSGAEIKAPVAPSSSEKVSHDRQKDPLPVVSRNHEWIQVEAWAIVRAGEELPDGSRLESWDESAAVVVSVDGRRERWRFRRPNEALALVAKSLATAAPVEVALPWSQESQKRE